MTHELQPINSDLEDLLNRIYGAHIEKFIKVGGCVVPEVYKTSIDDIENFEVRNDDVWVCSFPRTGTTWTQEMVWCIANDLNFEGAKELLTKRFLYFEITRFFDPKKSPAPKSDKAIPEYRVDSLSFVNKSPSPRFIKTHLPFNLLPRQLRNGETKAKIVYIARNAKDTCISFYHWTKAFEEFEESFGDWCKLFIGETLLYAPFWKHVLGFWNRRADENLLFLKYEDMKQDLPLVIQRTAEFLGKKLTIHELSQLTEHLSFAKMKVNPAVNNEDQADKSRRDSKFEDNREFIRSGTIGQWKTEMSTEDIEHFDDWTRKNLEGTGLTF